MWVGKIIFSAKIVMYMCSVQPSVFTLSFAVQKVKWEASMNVPCAYSITWHLISRTKFWKLSLIRKPKGLKYWCQHGSTPSELNSLKSLWNLCHPHVYFSYSAMTVLGDPYGVIFPRYLHLNWQFLKWWFP